MEKIMPTVTTTTEPKPGVKSTEFWAAIGIGGLPLMEHTGWFKNWPITEGAVMCSYIWSRAWVKVSTKGAADDLEIINASSRTGK